MPRIYGQWAGNPKGTPEDPDRCIAPVPGGARGIIYKQCSRKRGHGPGDLFCKQHARAPNNTIRRWIDRGTTEP